MPGPLATSGTTRDQDAHTVLSHPLPTPVAPPSSWESRDPSQERGAGSILFGARRRGLPVQLPERLRLREPGSEAGFPTSPPRATSSGHKTRPRPQTDRALSLTTKDWAQGSPGLGLCFSDVAVELPFTLMHPKPKEEPPQREGEQDLWVTGVRVSR